MENAAPKLSILIVNWRTRDLLLACLNSITSFPPPCGYETIVVDNASGDGSAAAVRDGFPAVTLIESGANLGYAAGNNLAFARAGGELLLTLNPDTEILPKTLERAVATLERHPRVGALGVRQIGNDGEVQRSVRGFPTLLGILGNLTGLTRRHPGSRWDSYRLTGFDYDREGPAPQPMGTFLLLRREALAAIGDPACPFDEAFPIFFNEVDLLRRLADAGWPALYTPHAEIRHHGGESTRQVRPMAIWESHRSLLRYLRKHSPAWKNVLTLPWLTPLIWVSALVRAKRYHAGFRP